jgi:serpin B
VHGTRLVNGGLHRPGPDPAEPPIDVPEADLKALADGNSQFAVELYKKLAEKTDGNIVVSPYSISSALAMTYAGARGETAEQMARTLHFTLPQDRLHPAFGTLTQRLQASGKEKQFQLNIANALWEQRGFPFLPEFLDLTRRNYGGGCREVDFIGDKEGARQTINHWVEEQTADRIKELLRKDDIKTNTRLVLTNAIYFKGDWERPFLKDQTRDEDFETAPGAQVKVPMMHHGGRFRYHAGPDFQVLELPYSGRRVSMVVLLPEKRYGLSVVEKSLTSDKLREGISKLSDHDGTVAFPRFKNKSRFVLNEPLKQLGIPLAFTEDADFSGINAGGGLHIQVAVHQGDVEVDEQGTEAAAATAVVLGVSAAPPLTFHADHPFLFFILDRTTGTILFLGRYTTPV